ncbi:MAG: ATP-binding protein [Erysipelotrichaceae bacterium]|nr:ATP-binding protein [Erysipelotrichaceae bacterium]
MEKLKVNMVVDEDQQILEQMKTAYENCPAAIRFLNELGVPEEVINRNLPKIFDFVSDINYCKKCPGAKACQKDRPLLVTKISYHNGYLDRELSPCREFLKKMLFEKQFLVRDFPEEWLDYDLRSLDKSDGRLQLLAKYSNFTKNGDNGWIYLTGASNSGRTFAAAIVTVDAAKKKMGPICFLNCSQRTRELSDLSYHDKDKFQRELDRYCNVPILVLDDFGNEFKNDFVRDAIIFPILSMRANKRLMTIITSDFTIKDIITLYSTSKPGQIRAKQIGKIMSDTAGKEINFGELSIY